MGFNSAFKGLTEFSILDYGEEGLCKRDIIIPTVSDAHLAL
jgi:hypothetical protein